MFASKREADASKPRRRLSTRPEARPPTTRCAGNPRRRQAPPIGQPGTSGCMNRQTEPHPRQCRRLTSITDVRLVLDGPALPADARESRTEKISPRAPAATKMVCASNQLSRGVTWSILHQQYRARRLSTQRVGASRTRSPQQLAAVPSEVWATSGLPAEARNAVLGFPDQLAAAGPETETATALSSSSTPDPP